MSDRPCPHCGHANDRGELYCVQCGARLRPSGMDRASEAPPAAVPSAKPRPLSVAPPPPAVKGVRDDPATRTRIDTLAGLIPEREPLDGLLYIAALPPDESAPAPLSPRGAGSPPAGPSHLPTGRNRIPGLHRHHWVFALMGLAALLSLWLAVPSEPTRPYLWDGVTAAWSVLNGLDTGPRVLVLWQNEPGVAGELDLPVEAVFRPLIGLRAEMHLVSQHPLALRHAQDLIDGVTLQVTSDQPLDGDPALFTPLAHTMDFWPGGYAVLPGLGTDMDLSAYDLQLIVTPNLMDAVHWLELVAPDFPGPVVAITSAGTGQLARPYFESGQLDGLISGYEGAYHFSQLTNALNRHGTGLRLSRFASVQNWVTACLLLVILLTLLTEDGKARWPTPRT